MSTDVFSSGFSVFCFSRDNSISKTFRISATPSGLSSISFSSSHFISRSSAHVRHGMDSAAHHNPCSHSSVMNLLLQLYLHELQVHCEVFSDLQPASVFQLAGAHHEIQRHSFCCECSSSSFYIPTELFATSCNSPVHCLDTCSLGFLALALYCKLRISQTVVRIMF